MIRVVKGLLALMTVALVVAGTPLLLLRIGRLDALHGVDWTHPWQTSDGGQLLLFMVTVLAWCSWVVVSATIVSEFVWVVSRQRLRIPVPGSAWLRPAAGVLVVAVVGLVMAQVGRQAPHNGSSSGPGTPIGVGSPAQPTNAQRTTGQPTTGQGTSAPTATPPGRGAQVPDPRERASVGSPTQGSAPHEGSGRHGSGGSPQQAGADHTADAAHEPAIYLVEPHDDLWDLAGRLYGDPTAWRRLAAANHLDSASLLYPGQALHIPGLSAHEVTQRTGQPAPDTTPRTIVVRAGDTLTGLAKHHLGTEAAWPALQQANPTLVIEPEHIEPGWVLHLPPRPAARHDRLAPSGSDRNGSAPAPTSQPAPTSHPGSPTRPGSTRRTDPTTETPPLPFPGPLPTSATPTSQHTAGQHTAGAPGAPASVPVGMGTNSAPVSAPVPSSPVPSSSVSSSTASAPRSDSPDVDRALVVSALAGVAALTAAGVLAAVRRRRREQDFDRPLGRRHPRPGHEGAAFDAALRRLGALDAELPPIEGLRLGATAVVLGEIPREQPSTEQSLPDATSSDATSSDEMSPDQMSPDANLREQVSRGPASGAAERVIVDLADAGALLVTGPRGLCRAAGAAVVVSLATAPWSDGVPVHVVSERLDWLAELGNPLVEVIGDTTSGMARLRRRLTSSLEALQHAAEAVPDDLPPDPDEVWVLDLLGLDASDQAEQVRATMTLLHQSGAPIRPVWLTTLPASRLRVLLDGLVEGPASGPTPRPDPGDLGDLLELRSDQRAELTGVADPFVPNLVSEPARRALVDLLGSATAVATEPAPWWAPEGRSPKLALTPTPPPDPARAARSTDPATAPDGTAATDPTDSARTLVTSHNTPTPRAFDAVWNEEPHPASAAPQPGVVTELPDTGRRHGAHPTGRLPLGRRPDTEHVEATVARLPETLANPAHPTLLVLGPVELRGAHGQPPARAMKQCLEYCGWILAHPRQTSVAMTRSLLVAEATRRSNMSRLRTWLGTTPEGEEYLPDAYSGRIQLHPLVTSDWEHLQLLTSAGVNRASNDALVGALELVRGAPMADAAPGQWHWAEEQRTEMQQAVRDIGVLLADRALAEGDVDLARWAAARALVVCPEDELLLATRVRTEHLAGNRPEVERLVLHLTRSARALGVDLSDDTVMLMQQVMEGRVRARA